MSQPDLPLPDSYEGLHNRARNQYQAGDLVGAIELYRRLVDRLGRLGDRVLDRRPDLRDLNRQARLEMSGLLNLEGRYAEAIEVEEVLLETHPEQADSWRRDIATLRVAKGEVDAGLAELRVLAEKNPGDALGWIVLGDQATIEGRFAEGKEALDRALEEGGEEAETLAEVHYQRFLLFRAMGQVDDAAAAWEESLKREPKVSSTVREVYNMLTEAGRYSEALRYVARDDNALQVGFQRGLVASLTGNQSQAQQEWRQVAKLDPEDFENGHDAWVESVLRLGDPLPALEWLQEALGRYSTPRLLVLSGIAWAMRQDSDLAARLFQQAINWLRRQRPPKQKLESADWRLLDSLVADDEIKAPLKPYFVVVETLWG